MHGGNIYDKSIRLDFSVNINPLGIPEEVKQALADAISHADCYPDPESRALRSALSKRLSLDPGRILLGNGASELIPAIVRAVRPKSALLVNPCFLGYARALTAAGIEPWYCQLPEERDFVPGEDFLLTIARLKPDLVFLTSPANPSGTLLSKSFLFRVGDVLNSFGGVLVCDACFLALSGREEESVLAVPEEFLKRTNLVVLNAFTKTYAIPGIRIGYAAFSSRDLAERTARELPEWNLSVPGQEAGLACLKVPDSYLMASTALIRSQREYLSASLSALGARVYPSEANFLLFRWKQEQDLYRLLLKQGILIRDCSDYRGLGKGYYRIAVKKRAQNEELIRCLKRIAAEGGDRR